MTNQTNSISLSDLVKEIAANSTKAYSDIIEDTVTEFTEKNNKLINKNAQGFIYLEFAYTSEDLLNDTDKLPEFAELHESLHEEAEKVANLHDEEEQDLIAFQRALRELSIKCESPIVFLSTIPETLIKFVGEKIIETIGYSSSVRKENTLKDVNEEELNIVVDFANKYSTYSVLAI